MKYKVGDMIVFKGELWVFYTIVTIHNSKEDLLYGFYSLQNMTNKNIFPMNFSKVEKLTRLATYTEQVLYGFKTN